MSAKLIKFTKKKAFTLLEMLVSITVFGIVSVIMTGIVLNMAGVSQVLDRRNDFIAELDSGVSILKNEMRNAQKLGLCNENIVGERSTALYIVKKPIASANNSNTAPKSYKVSVINGQLVMEELTRDPAEIGNNCNVNANAPKDFLTSKNMKIQKLTSVISTDESTPQNTLIYVSFEACDPDNVTRKNFNCVEQTDNYTPYKYMFGISTRNF